MRLRVDLIEGARIAITALWVNRLRTVLTTIGIGVGVATLLAIVGVIQGLDGSFSRQLASIGSNTLYVSKRPWIQFGNWWEFRNRKDISIEQLQAVRLQSTFAVAVAPMTGRMEEVSFDAATLPRVQITGTTADYLAISGFELVAGRFLTEADEVSRQPVVVIGADVADSLFGTANPVGSKVRISNRPFTVVGTLGRKGKLLDHSQDLVALIPFETHRAYFGRRGMSIGVAVESPQVLNAAEDQLVGILRRARSTPVDKPDDFAINRPEQLAATYRQLTGALYGVATGIGLITLLVGGIGIMNIMLVSVRERTREIGLRRALGAHRRTIVIQFVLEAISVSVVGGMLGTSVGLSVAVVLSWVTPLAAAVQPGTVLGGILFAAVVGLLFGIWPAARAASLDPVEALRYE